MTWSGLKDLPTLQDIKRMAATRGVPLGLRELVIGPGASAAVAGVAANLVGDTPGDLVMLVDETPYAGSGGSFKEWLLSQLASGARAVRQVCITGQSLLVEADEATMLRAEKAVRGAGVLVTVGSGTLADIGKVLSQRLNIPHVVVQTANSVNGFADDQSVLLRAGVKRTVPSRWPDALIVDIDVIALAPDLLNASGVGDLLSMFTAPADWLIASTAGLGPAYDDELVELVRPQGGRILDVAGRLGERNPHDLSYLAWMLSISGLTMGLAGTTAPSSGTEHVISHVLEMTARASGLPSSHHGERVGIATLVAAGIWSRVRRHAPARLPMLVKPEPDWAKHEALNAFRRLGKVAAEECWTAYEKKLNAWYENPDSLTRLMDEWPALQDRLDDLLGDPRELVASLQASGAPVRFGDLASKFDQQTVHWAVYNAHRMRDRFLIADLAELMGIWTPELVSDVLAELNEWGAGW
ncbi:iron-containing alcohol dehydrogenase [Kribbella ginsengisoli]|uniref:Iron-containing alcohol dehydrogenase n=1 Tax=Kribbella ginsengisoli TaxID=363865 RepID=A0ABP6Z7V5_9ACTN